MKVYEKQMISRELVFKPGYYVICNETGQVMREGLTCNKGANAIIAVLKTRFPNKTFSAWYKM